MERFLENYPPFNCNPAAPELLKKYADKLPQPLLDLWKNVGLGKYKQGLIEIINPEDYEDALWTYLGKEVEYYVPIAINAFGDLFYYRMLSEPEDVEEGEEIAEDVCVIEIHYREIATCIWSLDDFFNDYLCDEEVITNLLRKELFDKAVLKKGELTKGEIYFFAPALLVGGTENIEIVQKGDARTHQELLFEMGL